MSLSTNVPNFTVDHDLPFLLQVRFDDYAMLLAAISGEIGNLPGDESIDRISVDIKQPPPRTLLTRYVGFNGKLTELLTILGSAGVNSTWIRGAPGTGKTALAEELIRARAEHRLGGATLSGPFFLFNVSLFLTRAPSTWVDEFNKSLNYVKNSHGLLFIDHIDDLIKASGSSSDVFLRGRPPC